MTTPIQKLLRASCAVAISVAGGCATGRMSGKDLVKLTADPGPECTYVTTVTGVNPWGAELENPRDRVDWAERDARDKAAAAGATHIRFEPASDPDRAVAKAYRCEASSAPQPGSQPAPAAAAAPAATVAGCTKDIECKGDRICEAGRCVEPPARPPPARQ